MNDSPDSSQDARSKAPSNTSGTGGVLALIGVAVLAAPMWWSWNYQLPSGKHMDAIGFVSLWFRELVILGFAVSVLLLILAVSVAKRIRVWLTAAK